MFYTYAFYMYFCTHTVSPSSGNILAHKKHWKGILSSRAGRNVRSPELDYNTRRATEEEFFPYFHIWEESCYLLYSQDLKKQTEHLLKTPQGR